MNAKCHYMSFAIINIINNYVLKKILDYIYILLIIIFYIFFVCAYVSMCLINFKKLWEGEGRRIAMESM